MRWRAVHRWSLLNDRGTFRGLPTDDAKTADGVFKLVVLGAAVIVDWPSKACVAHVAYDKADKW